MSPILLCTSVCSKRHLHVVVVVRGPLHVGHLPCMGCLPMFYFPHSLVTSVCICVFWGYLHVIWGIFPLCQGLGGVPHLLGVLEASAHGVSICFFLYILVVHYVTCFYYSYNYYSSSYGGVFWAIICFISDCGSFLDGASCNIG